MSKHQQLPVVYLKLHRHLSLSDIYTRAIITIMQWSQRKLTSYDFSFSTKKYICVFMFIIFRSKMSMYMQYLLKQKTRRFLTVAVRLTKHRPVPRRCPVPGRALVDLLRYFIYYKFMALVRHCRWNRTIKLKQKIVRCPSDVCKHRPGDVILPSMTLLNAVRAPWCFK